MRFVGFMDYLPLWGLALGTLVVVVLSVEGGFRLGRHRGQRSPEGEAPLGAIVAATLGLVAFLLAFTFGLASSRFDVRREALLHEANAIGTAYLRAQFLPEPERTNARDLLREYVDVRLEGVLSGNVRAAIQRSEVLHVELWSHATAAAEKNPSSIVVGLFLESLNDVIDFHTNRVAAGLRAGIPPPIWLALYAYMVMGMVLMGYQLGVNDRRRSVAILAFAFAFSVVLLLIADLDRPQEGLIKVSQQAMIDLRNTIAP